MDYNGKMNKEKLRISLSRRINITVTIVLAVGLSAVALAFALSLIRQGESQSSQNLGRSTELIYESIANMMISGEAPIAVNYFKDVKGLGNFYTIDLFRRDGNSAFSDNVTIETVNRNQSFKKFALRNDSAGEFQRLEKEYFAESLSMPPHPIYFRLMDPADGKTYDRAYRPILNLPKCVGCHGADHTVRGVIDIRTDISPLLRTQAFIIGGAALGFLFMAAFIVIVLSRFLHTLVVEPVRAIGDVCSRVSTGDFTGTVDIANRDEVGELGKTVNEMVHGLHERYELTKYVSSGTLKSLSSGQKSEKVNRTLLFTDVRGFTAYTERNGADAIVSVLNSLFEEQTRIINSFHGDIDKFVGDEVVAVFSGDDAAYRACLAADAIRRVVYERRQVYDGLSVGAGIATGLVIQGMLGSSLRADFTVIGDKVNVAARLCGIARPNEIVVCDCTLDALKGTHKGLLRMLPAVKSAPPYYGEKLDAIVFLGPFSVSLKGKLEEQHVYVLRGTPAGISGEAEPEPPRQGA